MNAFQDLAAGRAGRLLEAALETARDEYPDLDVRCYLRKFDSLVQGFDLYLAVHGVAQADPAAVLEALQRYFFTELGFAPAGENYYDPRNSYVNEVLDRRTGIPITLSVIFRALAASAGVELCGVNLPGHFVLAFPARLGPRTYVDVYNGGVRLDWAECCRRARGVLEDGAPLVENDFPPMPERDILVRMLRNLKGIYAQTDHPRALRIQERLIQLLPGAPAELRDLALLYACNNKPILAHRTFEQLVRQHPTMGETDFIQERARHAAREAALVN